MGAVCSTNHSSWAAGRRQLGWEVLVSLAPCGCTFCSQGLKAGFLSCCQGCPPCKRGFLSPGRKGPLATEPPSLFSSTTGLLPKTSAVLTLAAMVTTPAALLRPASSFHMHSYLPLQFSDLWLTFQEGTGAEQKSEHSSLAVPHGHLRELPLYLNVSLPESNEHAPMIKKVGVEPYRDEDWFSSCCLDISHEYLRASGYVKKIFFPPSLNLYKKA